MTVVLSKNICKVSDVAPFDSVSIIGGTAGCGLSVWGRSHPDNRRHFLLDVDILIGLCPVITLTGRFGGGGRLCG
jgi:hypothetical protein